MSLLRDEQGAWSMARVSFSVTLLWTLILVTLAGLRVVALSSAAYGLLGGILTGLTAWAAGPRMAQYIAPAMGNAMQNVSLGKGDTEPDRFKDDERGA